MIIAFRFRAENIVANGLACHVAVVLRFSMFFCNRWSGRGPDGRDEWAGWRLREQILRTHAIARVLAQQLLLFLISNRNINKSIKQKEPHRIAVDLRERKCRFRGVRN